MLDDKSSPLIESRPSITLYDPICTLDVERSTAIGYLVLLSGKEVNLPSPSRKKRGKRDRGITHALPTIVDPANNTLAFFSLTDGNVLEGCFGACSQRRDTSSPAYRMARDAKIALVDAAETNPTVRTLAVDTYCKAFLIVIEHHDEIDLLNPCSKCCKQGEVRRKAENDLRAVFQTLSEAVNDAVS